MIIDEYTVVWFTDGKKSSKIANIADFWFGFSILPDY